MKTRSSIVIVCIAAVCGCGRPLALQSAGPKAPVSRSADPRMSPERVAQIREGNALFEAGRAAVRSHDWSLAETKLEQATVRDPDNLFAARLLADVYRQEGRNEDALRVMQSLVSETDRIKATYERDPIALTMMGELADAVHDPGTARDAYRRAAASAPLTAGPHLPSLTLRSSSPSDVRASAYASAGLKAYFTADPTGAVDYFKKAVAAAPDDPGMRFYLAYTLARSKPPRASEALVEYERVAKSGTSTFAAESAKEAASLRNWLKQSRTH